MSGSHGIRGESASEDLDQVLGYGDIAALAAPVAWRLHDGSRRYASSAFTARPQPAMHWRTRSSARASLARLAFLRRTASGPGSWGFAAGISGLRREFVLELAKPLQGLGTCRCIVLPDDMGHKQLGQFVKESRSGPGGQAGRCATAALVASSGGRMDEQDAASHAHAAAGQASLVPASPPEDCLGDCEDVERPYSPPSRRSGDRDEGPVDSCRWPGVARTSGCKVP